MNDSLAHKAAEIAEGVLANARYGFYAAAILFIEKYIFSDWPFLMFMSVLIILDTALGVSYAFFQSRISVKKLAGILIKLVVYGSVLVVGHVIENATISGNQIPGGVYFKVVIYTSLIALEGMSIFRNLGKIDKDLVPKFILKRFEGFNETGDFNELTGNNPPSLRGTKQSSSPLDPTNSNHPTDAID